MGFWRYIDWPPAVRRQTLIYVRDNKVGKLISINVLEYAAVIVNYAASCWFYQQEPDESDPFPVVRLNADNTSADSWMETACNSSLIGRALSRLQCALMINNAVGFHTGHVTTAQNVIEDRISCIKRKTHSMSEFVQILQDYPGIAGRRRFQPSAELISHVMDAILQKKFVDPVTANNAVLNNPGQIIS